MDRKHSVLIVDDTPENLQVLGDMLEQDGYEVLVSTNGPDALDNAMSAPPPDLILLDIMMPDMDGFEVCRLLKASSKTQGIPVIFISALDMPEQKVKAFREGAVDYVTKPFQSEEVLARVNTHIQLKLHRENLQLLVEQRTAELANLNAGLEKQIADEVEKSIQKDHLMFQQSRLVTMGETLSFIAHQWRQPLNNIGLSIQALLMDYQDGICDNQMLTSFVDTNMAILHYLSQTIQDFSTFFRREAVCSAFDPYQMVERAVGLVQATFKQNGISLLLDNQCTRPVWGYGNEFSQVILNFLVNARDVLLERQVKEPVIEIRCYCEEDSCCIAVRDNGGGIPEDIMGRIFDPYFTTKFQSQGTGIGLYMAKMIIEKHMAGSCTASNTSGGAEFVIRLPAHSG